MMLSLFDQIPFWWIIPFLMTGGGVAALFLIPGAIPLAVGVWNASPLWLRVVLVGITGGLILYAKGRHDANVADREAQRKRDTAAVSNRQTINREVTNLDKPAADKRLEPWMRD